MKLLSLKLRNFKGMKEFDLDPDGESQAIFGDNGTGKTTLFDAFTWLLFDKDSGNRKDFEIKTLGPDGKAIHGLEHEVEGVLEIDGRQISLNKIYSENWTKKRGSVDREFTGHTTNYFLDGVPTKKNEYEARIASIVDEDAFKLLTNPRHFNEVLHWQDRRKILLEVCGDLGDAEVIASDSKLAKLPEILNGRKLEDHRKVIAARRAAINKDIELIPVRISEVERGLPNILDDPSLNVEMEALKAGRSEKEKELANLQAGGGVAEKTKELNLVETDIEKAERERWTQAADQAQTQKLELRTLEGQAIGIASGIEGRKVGMKEVQASIAQYDMKLEQLRQDWHTVNSARFTHEQSDNCPTCGQALPLEQLDSARELAERAFNEVKAKKLQEITEEGKVLKTKTDEWRIGIGEMEQNNSIEESNLAELNQKMVAMRDALAALDKEGLEPLALLPAYTNLLQKKTAIEQEIAALNNSNAGAVAAMRADISSIDAKIEACESTIARSKQRETGLQRIEELKAEERTLAAEFEKLEGELFLADEFVRTKVKLLEERINSRFMLARFKLFNELVNGGIEEVCETTYLGVPYSSALNNSARINIGLDIINTLSDHFKFVAPIWIDNAEAVTQLVATKGQQITLYVREADKVMRIEGAKEAVA